MAKKTSEFLKGMGKAFEILKEIINAVLELGGNDEDLSRILSDQELRQKIAELIVAKKAVNPTNTISLKGESLQELIKSCANDWVNGDITSEHFPIEPKSGVFEVRLEHLNLALTTKEVKERIASLISEGWEYGQIDHQLAYGIKNPDDQRKFPIIALGSVWRDGHGYSRPPCLDRGGDRRKRKLNLSWYDDGSLCGEDCRFLLVRKVS